MSQAADMAAWRSWAESAPPELLERFEAMSGSLVAHIRREYRANCGPGHPLYQEMKERASRALLDLTESVGAQDDAVD